MNKIKIFVDAHVFDSSYQGTTTYIKGIYSEIVKDSAFEITLAAYNIENLKKNLATLLLNLFNYLLLQRLKD